MSRAGPSGRRGCVCVCVGGGGGCKNPLRTGICCLVGKIGILVGKIGVLTGR